jgi:hypothetical protein
MPIPRASSPLRQSRSPPRNQTYHYQQQPQSSFISGTEVRSPYDSRALQRHEETKRAFEDYQRRGPQEPLRTSTFGDHGVLPLRHENPIQQPFRTHYPEQQEGLVSGSSDITSEGEESEGEGESSYGDISSATDTNGSPAPYARPPLGPRPEI